MNYRFIPQFFALVVVFALLGVNTALAARWCFPGFTTPQCFATQAACTAVSTRCSPETSVVTPTTVPTTQPPVSTTPPPAAPPVAQISTPQAPGSQSTVSGYQLLAPIPTIDKTTGITLVDYMKGVFVATIGLAIVLAVVELVIGGIEYVAAAVPSSKEDAKRRIGGAIGGLLLILLAYVLLQALNPALLRVGLNLEQVAVSGQTGGGGGGGGNQQYCLVGGDTGQTFDSLQACKDTYPLLADKCGTCASSSGGGGQCSPVSNTNNPCSVSNLTGVFGGDTTKATNASIVCQGESSGNALVGGDKIVGGPNNGTPVSFGLFQINLSAPPNNAAIGGLTNCPSAFDSPYSGSHKNVVIVNQGLYDQCKAAAQNADNNIQAMLAGSNNGTKFSPMWTVATNCGIK